MAHRACRETLYRSTSTAGSGRPRRAWSQLTDGAGCGVLLHGAGRSFGIASAASHYGDGAYPNGAQRAGKQPASPGPRGGRRVLLDGGNCDAATSATSSCHAAAAVAAPYGAAAAAGDAHCAYAGPATNLLSDRHTTSLTSIPTRHRRSFQPIPLSVGDSVAIQYFGWHGYIVVERRRRY